MSTWSEGKAVPLQAWTSLSGRRNFDTPKFLDNQHMKRARLSALRNGHIDPSEDIPGTHFCYRLNRPRGHNAAGKKTFMKNPTGNRTHDLPACSAEPQPTAQSRATVNIMLAITYI
jgi:hypothetical protein